MKRLFVFLLLFGALGVTFAQTAEDYGKKAMNAFNSKDYPVALKAINQAIRLDSSIVEFVYLKAATLLEMKEYREAYHTYCEGISLFPRDFILYNDRADLLLNMQQFDDAIKDFTMAIALAEEDSVRHFILVNRSSAKSHKRDFKGAYEDLMLAYQTDSTDVAMLNNLGSVCDEIGKRDDALRYLLKAVEVDPSFYPAYGNIGFLYQEMGQHEKAIEIYDKVLQVQPNEPLGYSNRSYNRYKLGDLKGAMKDIEKAIKLYPGNSYAYRTRALIHIANGNVAEACDDLQAALDRGFTAMYGDAVLKLMKEHCD